VFTWQQIPIFTYVVCVLHLLYSPCKTRKSASKIMPQCSPMTTAIAGNTQVFLRLLRVGGTLSKLLYFRFRQYFFQIITEHSLKLQLCESFLRTVPLARNPVTSVACFKLCDFFWCQSGQLNAKCKCSPYNRPWGAKRGSRDIALPCREPRHEEGMGWLAPRPGRFTPGKETL
jgi:hypothetical protein